MHKVIHRTVLVLGVLSLSLLIILSLIGFISFGQGIRQSIQDGAIAPAYLVQLLDIVLLIFIFIELLNIALAFIEERQVVPRVFEAVLVAIARKIIVSGTDAIDLDKAGALALLTLAVSLSWWLVSRTEGRVS